MLALIALGVFAAGAAIARGQSGSHGLAQPVAYRTKRAPSHFALEGYCPVCIIEMKKWVFGDSRFQAEHDGKTYLLPSEKQKEMFLANPAKYVPALGGDCTVCYAKMGRRVPGNIRHGAFYGGRLFLFPSADQQKEFFENPTVYSNIDLALDGKCAVCLTEMGKDMPGKPEFTAIHQGFRYQFPAEKPLDMFLANPTKYTAEPTDTKRVSAVENSEVLVTISGKSACAGCDHGVVPIGAPEELGLAVDVKDGNVYVIENAHELYPEVYEKRFEKLELRVSGKVLKRDGKITWLVPSRLEVLNQGGAE